MSGPRPVVIASVWMAGAALATGTGLLAVRAVATEVGDPSIPLLQAADVIEQLREVEPSAQPRPSAPAVSAAPSPSGRATVASAQPVRSTRPLSAPRRFASAGGTVAVQCRAGSLQLLYATPVQGFALARQDRSRDRMEVRFENATSRVRMTVACAAAGPVLVERRTQARTEPEPTRPPDDAEGDDSGGDGGTGSSGDNDSGEKVSGSDDSGSD